MLLADAVEVSDRLPSEPTFKIFSGVLKAYDGNDGRKYISCTASSSVEDLHGDTMTDDCVRDMAGQAMEKAMTIFLNHHYAVPEDVFGSTVDTKIVSRAADNDGEAIYDFDLVASLNETNPRAVATYAALKDAGVKLGVSIGAMIEDWDYKDEKQGFWGGLIIKKVNLLEASIVGIPANPRSWVQNGVRAIKALYDTEPSELHQVSRKLVLNGADVTDQVTQTITDENITKGTTETIVVKPETPEAVASAEPANEQDPTTDPKDPDVVETPNSDSAEPEVTAGTTDEEPTSPVDLAALTGDALAVVKDGDSTEAPSLIAKLLIALNQIKSERDDARAALVVANTELEDKKLLLAEATEIVTKIANTPLGRKTAFSGPVRTFQQRFASVYDSEYLKMLDEGDK